MTALSQRSGTRTNRQLQENLVSLAIVYRPVERLQLSADNPRHHTKKQISQIARSLETFGFLVPVLVDGALRVIAGHGRAEAAKLLGMHNLPTVSIEHLTEDQIKAFRIADNKLATNSQWDEKLLGEQLKTLTEVELNFSLEATGFELREIDLLTENLQPDAESDPVADAFPEAESSVHVTVPGDLWVLGRNRVFCGDSLDPSSYVKVMAGRKAKMVFTDPPCTVPVSGDAVGLGSIHHQNFQMAVGKSEAEFNDFLTRIFNLLIPQTFQGSIHFVVVDRHHTREVFIAGSHAYSKLRDICVWTKNEAEVGSFYRNQHQLVFVFENGKNRLRDGPQPTQPGRNRSNVWRYPRSKSRSRVAGEGHSGSQRAATPVPLVADAILDCSNRGELVLDPFLGCGATVIAAQQTGRICCGIEIDPDSVDKVMRRWQTFTGLSATHAASGRSFREREEEVRNALNH